jgi:hypothetical protein
MKRKAMMAVAPAYRPKWVLVRNRQSARLTLPPVLLAGFTRPLKLFLDFDVAAIDETIDRLTDLREKMAATKRKQAAKTKARTSADSAAKARRRVNRRDRARSGLEEAMDVPARPARRRR